jgi:CxxC-x17-CxxC domain-containing protein
MYEDKTLPCKDCGNEFEFTAGEQEFYEEKGLSAPQRCKDCRAAKKARMNGPREMHPAVCAECNADCEVPFKPRPVEEGGKPVLCRDCFSAARN